MLIRTLPLTAALLFCVGCGGTASRLYTVSVKNETLGPLTVALTKDGPPFEPAWASPEDIAAGRGSLGANDQSGFAAVKPGSTQSVKDVPGRFSPETHAFLRVYRGGDLSIKDMLQLKVGPNRQDIPLQGHDDRYIIRDAGGALHVESAP